MSTKIKDQNKLVLSSVQNSLKVSPANYQYGLMVFIGRMQPFHLGHFAIIEQALKLGRKVLVLIGSAYSARSSKNPLSTHEVMQMIRGCFTVEENSRIILRGLRDVYNDTLWNREVQKIVREVQADSASNPSVCLIGHRKDGTSYYLSMFPQWSSVGLENIDSINATDIRKLWFAEKGSDFSNAQQIMPEFSYNFMLEMMHKQTHNWLLEEIDEYERIKARYPAGRRPVIVTVDGVVIQSAHVLLIERSVKPGRGLLSLPGGHPKDSETMKDTLVGNLVMDHGLLVTPQRSREEAAKLVSASVRAFEVFDSPYRSDITRPISHTYLVEIPNDSNGLHKLRSGSYGKADWYPLADIDALSDRIISDHAHIINRMEAKASWLD